MKLSSFGQKFTNDSGILHLMEDLGNGIAGGDVLMLGGGNPSHIPEIEACLRDRMAAVVGDPATFSGLVGNYAPPQGDKAFLSTMADFLRREFNWPVTERNIALTNGSQTAFFYLFNLLAGRYEDGTYRRILLPLVPEYIGYTDVGIDPAGLFTTFKPQIEYLEKPFFKYHIDFDALEVAEDVSAICVSRPTNPSGNVLTDEEIAHLHQLAIRHDIPLIIDNAYGRPFPGIIFTEAKPFWDEHVIYCMSLSKFGMPGVRTGIIIASEDIITAVSGLNAIVGLAPGNTGAYLANDLVSSGEIMEWSRAIIRPHYEAKIALALDWLQAEMGDIEYYIHKPEGTFFLWLWFKGLPISSQELYERLKARGVLIVPGHHFFPGLDEPWDHRQECIRVNVAMDEQTVREGLRLIAHEVRGLLS